MLDIALLAGVEVIDTEHLAAGGENCVAEMRADKTRTPGDENPSRLYIRPLPPVHYRTNAGITVSGPSDTVIGKAQFFHLGRVILVAPVEDERLFE